MQQPAPDKRPTGARARPETVAAKKARRARSARSSPATGGPAARSPSATTIPSAMATTTPTKLESEGTSANALQGGSPLRSDDAVKATRSPAGGESNPAKRSAA